MWQSGSSPHLAAPCLLAVNVSRSMLTVVALSSASLIKRGRFKGSVSLVGAFKGKARGWVQ